MKLPERLNTAYAAALMTDLQSAMRDNEAVDGSDVVYVGGLCFQILIASKVQVINGSDAFKNSMSLFGHEGANSCAF